MTKEITKANIIQEITDKFALRELEPERFSFLESVRPVYNIEPHLTHNEVMCETVSVTSQTYFLFFTVPDDEEWLLHRYNVIFMTGSYKVTGLILGRPSLTAGDYIYVDMTLNQTVSYAVNLPTPIRLTNKEKIYIYVDDYTATGDLRVLVDLTVVKRR